MKVEIVFKFKILGLEKEMSANVFENQSVLEPGFYLLVASCYWLFLVHSSDAFFTHLTQHTHT